MRVRAMCLAALLSLLGCPNPSSGGQDAATAAADAHVQGGDAAVTTLDAGGLPDASPGMDAGGHADAATPMDAATAVDAHVAQDAAVTPDAAVGADAGNGGGDGGGFPWRTTFGSCWNTSACHRALVLSHGGDWGGAVPYGSHSAHVRAFEDGADAVKVDVRVTMDGVPLVVHSSPFEFWETLNCGGQKIEEMTAAQVSGCHMLPSTTESFPRLDDTINWARGRINLMFTVKETRDFPAAMALAQSLNALDFVLLEVGPGDITTNLPPVSGWDQFYYDVQLSSLAELTSFLALPRPPGVVAVALDLNEFTEPQADISAAITAQVTPAGLHALTPSDKLVPTVDDHVHRWDLGFDILYSYNTPNGITGRTQVNTTRGISPP